MRIRSINPTGTVDNVVADTNETFSTMPVSKKVITHGFYTYRGQGTQKKKRGEPDGMLRLYFQNYTKDMSRVARGFYPNTSIGGMDKLKKKLYIPGSGLMIGDILVRENMIESILPSGGNYKAAIDTLFKTKNVALMKVIAEACTRKSGTYRSPIEFQYRIET